MILYLYRAILAIIRSKNLIALATAHSRFKLPLQIENNITCNIRKQSGLRKLLH